jgi:hypothetical protein
MARITCWPCQRRNCDKECSRWSPLRSEDRAGGSAKRTHCKCLGWGWGRGDRSACWATDVGPHRETDVEASGKWSTWNIPLRTVLLRFLCESGHGRLRAGGGVGENTEVKQAVCQQRCQDWVCQRGTERK